MFRVKSKDGDALSDVLKRILTVVGTAPSFIYYYSSVNNVI